MTLHTTTRTGQRWLGMLFALMSVALWIALGIGATVPQWAYFLPLVPLALMMLTGLYLFFQPYARRNA